MGTRKKTVGTHVPTKLSHAETITKVLEDLTKNASFGLNKLKIKALQIFLSVCECENKKKEADKKLQSIKDKM